MLNKEIRLPAALPRRWREPIVAALLLTALTLCLFGDVLVAGRHVVLSNLHCDLATEFLPMWQFGFEHLSRGDLVLWNPHIFGGAPFFGNFQSALLYPLNWLFLVLPVHLAINLSIALHVLILGLGMYAWARLRGMSTPAGLLAAVMAMLGGASFLHIYAGHFPHLCTMAWAPLAMAAIDGCFDRRKLSWALLGALALTLMILAGFPQKTLFTGVAAGVYVIVRLGARAMELRREGARAVGRQLGVIAALLTVIVVAGSAIGAVQLLAGLEASHDSVRGSGLSIGRAGSFSFPPENLLTLVAPEFFSGVANLPYWGRWHRWEATLFVSIAGLLLAILGAVRGRVTARWAILVTLAAALLLAFGMYTPVYGLLYAHVPLLQKLRGMGKFAFQATLLAALLAGAGLDHLLASRRTPWALCGLAVLAAVAAVAGVIWIHGAASQGEMGSWRSLVAGMDRGVKGELRPVLLDAHAYDYPPLMLQLAGKAMDSLLIAAGVLVLCAILLALSRRWRAAPYVLALLAATELIVFAARSRPTFDPDHARTTPAYGYVAAKLGEARVLNPYNGNEAMTEGLYDIWGRGPDVRRRWAEYLYFAQGEPLEGVSQYSPFRNWDRWRLFVPTRLASPPPPVDESIPPDSRLLAMPRLNLVKQWRIIAGRDNVLAAMLEESFDPRQTVILERSPGLKVSPATASTSAPAGDARAGTGAPGKVRCMEQSTDFSVIEAELSAPAVLLITDAYDRAWRATALPGSAQTSYTLMPGDWAFQAVPLEAGHHRIRVEYRPTAFVVGKWISLAALGAYAASWLWLLRARKRTRPSAAP